MAKNETSRAGARLGEVAVFICWNLGCNIDSRDRCLDD